MDPNTIGRFDKSFVVRMIRGFFLSVLALMVLQIGLGFLMVLYEFEREGKRNTYYAAEQLAADVRSIMLNHGGPVAARTVYPILRRNHQARGLEIAIVPSPVTVSSIKAQFDFKPQGLSPEWPQGERYQEHTVRLTAEPFCLQCHAQAEVGDVLGQVTVRNYFSSYVTQWLDEARITSITSMVDIISSTIILYILLRIRMDPLLGLRSVVSRRKCSRPLLRPSGTGQYQRSVQTGRSMAFADPSHAGTPVFMP